MVERRKRGGRSKPKLLGNHQRCWIWGRNLVLETLKAGRWPIVELLIDPDVVQDRMEWIEDRCATLGVDVRAVGSEAIRQTCHSTEHQGYAAKMAEFPYTDWHELIAQLSPKSLILACDQLQDPHNFGALLRSADAFGFRDCLVEQCQQVGVTSHVARASSGAVNHIRITRVDSLVEAVRELCEHQVQSVVASHDAETVLSEIDWRQPTVLVIGNEGTGVRQPVRHACQNLVRIPTVGQTESLNAAVSGSILMYEAHRMRSL